MIDAQEFKQLFGEVAENFGFARAYGGWYKELAICSLVLELQKSQNSPAYYLNLKIFLAKRGSNEKISKRKVKTEPGDIFRRQSADYDRAFDLESGLSLEQRRKWISKLFEDDIEKLVTAGTSPNRLIELHNNKVVYILPHIMSKLNPN